VANNLPTTAVILAGGLGTRLRSIVADRPKPMALVADRPFLEHLIGYWHRQGIQRFIISIGYLGEMIEAHLGTCCYGSELVYVTEPSPLGTGGALLHCQQQLQLKDPFLLLNGDTYFAVQLADLHQRAFEQAADWVFSLFPTHDDQRYLSATLSHEGRLRFGAADATNKAGEQRWANGGVYWVRPQSLLPFANELNQKISLEEKIFPRCQQLAQRFYGLPSQATFIDIGVPDDYARAQTMPCFCEF